MDMKIGDKLEILSSGIRAAKMELEALLSVSGHSGESPDRITLRSRVEEKLTALLFEFIELAEDRFRVAV